jgi:hypothetical protein
MTKITQFNSQNIDVIRAAIELKLAEVSEQYGILLHAGGMSYSHSKITTRLTIKIVSEDVKDGESIEEASARSDFALYAPSLGLAAEDFGKEVRVDGKQFKIVGIAPRSRKYPILGETIDGKKTFKLAVNAIRNQLHIAEVEQ